MTNEERQAIQTILNTFPGAQVVADGSKGDDVSVINEKMSAALCYAASGWFVFPVSAEDKRPLVSGSFYSASRDAATIRGWWAKWPDANIGLPTGKVNGLFVVDIDNKQNPETGETGWDSWAKLKNNLTEEERQTLKATTPGGGGHLYFFNAGLVDTCASNGKIAHGIDIKTDGGYIIAPPSDRPGGGKYAWHGEGFKGLGAIHAAEKAASFSLVPIPHFFLMHTQKAALPQVTREDVEAKWKDFSSRKINTGERDDTLARLAGHLIGKGVALGAVLACVAGVNKRQGAPPIGDKDVERIVGSISRTHKRNN
jgi:hypothetical protein